jgi:hypothetical protein
MLFGDIYAVHDALDARDGESAALSGNAEISDLIGSVQDGAIWSVLDNAGSRDLLRAALGDTARLTDSDLVKKRLAGAYYTVDFAHGIDLNLTLAMGDAMTAASLSSLLKIGLVLKKMTATPDERTAMEATTVDNNNGNLVMHFSADDNKFQSLLQSDLFAAITRH